MDIEKVIKLLAEDELANGSGWTALALEKLLENFPTTEEELANHLYEIYEKDKSKIWYSGYVRAKQVYK